MSLFERFMGRPEPEEIHSELVANTTVENPPSYVLLFPERLDIDADALTLALQSYHPSLASAKAELMDAAIGEAPREGGESFLGLAGWGNHVIKLIGIDAPVPPQLFESCVRPAHFNFELKQAAQQHQSQVLLIYAGYERDPVEQYVALTVVAASLARFDALLLLNENARTAFPAAAMLSDDPNHDALDLLRSMPLPLLYSGFVKMEVEGEPGVWMRTFGNKLLNLPDLALRATGHHEGSDTFELFANMLAYLRESGKQLAPGHTMQVGANVHLRFRSPTAEEWNFLHSDGEMLVAEPTAPDNTNATLA